MCRTRDSANAFSASSRVMPLAASTTALITSSLGFVNEVVPEGQAVEAAKRWAALILAVFTVYEEKGGWGMMHLMDTAGLRQSLAALATGSAVAGC